MSDEYLTLKWGSLKAWNIAEDNEAARAAFERWASPGVGMSAMAHRDTAEQKQAICDLIDAMNIESVYLDWAGEYVSKDEGKKYVLEYGA